MSDLVAAGEGRGTAMDAVAASVPEREAAAEAMEREVALLDEILAVWRARALEGDPTAVDKVLEIQKQRLVLRQVWPAGSSGSSGVKVSAGAAARGDEREVRVVVEYVDDWRQAGRRSGV